MFHWEPSLLVPALVPSFMEPELMEISYQIVLELFAVKARPVLARAFPVLIGTSPVLPGVYQSPQHHSSKVRPKQLPPPLKTHLEAFLVRPLGTLHA